ncbi:competence protein CoiA [Bacillus sp. NPDC077027]|uniref:competence protein CoiA n=1 Tax=Bacillus sp. NPDC077027 TaxID=3390548 RepID=UPI003CFDF6BB
MYTALTENGEIIHLSSRYSKRSLERARRTCKFYCPVCKKEVRLKLGDHRMYHFSHIQQHQCPHASEGETDYHHLGKKTLYDWLKTNGKLPQLEPYFQSIKQRPDVIVTEQGKRYAIEFQCANLSYQVLKKRTAGLHKEKTIPVWLIGANRLKRKTSQLFSFSALHWHMLRLSKEQRLLFFCPVTQAVIYLDHIIPFQSTKTCADIRVVSLRHFKGIIDLLQLPKPKQTHKHWSLCVRQFRRKPPRILTNESKKLQQLFYTHHHTAFSFLPPEVFVPITSSYIFASPVYVWQGFIYDFIVRKMAHSSFTIKMLTTEIKKRIMNREIKLRYACITSEQIEEVLYVYVSLLVQQGFLACSEAGKYRLQMKTKPILTLDEVMKLDSFLFNKHDSAPL